MQHMTHNQPRGGTTTFLATFLPLRGQSGVEKKEDRIGERLFFASGDDGREWLCGGHSFFVRGLQVWHASMPSWCVMLPCHLIHLTESVPCMLCFCVPTRETRSFAQTQLLQSRSTGRPTRRIWMLHSPPCFHYTSFSSDGGSHSASWVKRSLHAVGVVDVPRRQRPEVEKQQETREDTKEEARWGRLAMKAT